MDCPVHRTSHTPETIVHFDKKHCSRALVFLKKMLTQFFFGMFLRKIENV